MFVCKQCISEKDFCNWISKKGVSGICSFDNNHKGTVVDIEDFVDHFDTYFQENFMQGEEFAYMVDSSDNPQYDTRGAYLFEIIQDELNCQEAVTQAIIEHLPCQSYRDIAQGEEPFYQTDVTYESKDDFRERFELDSLGYLLEQGGFDKNVLGDNLCRFQNLPTFLSREIKEINSEVISYLKKNPKKILDLHSRRFEELMAEILASFGWEVQLTKMTRDGGYDIFGISKDQSGIKSNWLVECKRYKADRTVGIDVARSLYGVKQQHQIGNVLLATTSHFSSEVEKFKCSMYDFHLRDFNGIIKWINDYKPHPSGRWYVDKKNGLTLPK